MAESIFLQSENEKKYTTVLVLKSKIAADLGFGKSSQFTHTVINEKLLDRYNADTGATWTEEKFLKARLLPPSLANYIVAKL